jgi:choline monooxygenase
MPPDASNAPDPDRARTAPGALHDDAARFDRLRDTLFARSWHVLGTTDEVPEPGGARPATLLPGLLDEPLLLARPDSGPPRLLSNVCTHRGALLCEAPCAPAGGQIRCRYHGRRFALDGRFVAAPGFEAAADFPSAADDLPSVPCGRWGPLLFGGVRPGHELEELIAPLQALVGWLPLDRARIEPSRSGDFLVPAHWALYCENYLEGFHVPFVHPSLATVLDWQDYETRLWPRGSVQVGFAKDDAPEDGVLRAPAGHPDHGRKVAGYYAWLWPCTMINVYPWGLSLNLVQPLAPDRTRVRFLACVWEAARLERGAGAGLHQVECEDEEVVGSVQRGTRSRLWRGGRLAPRHEAGVRHFREMLAAAEA